MSAGPSQLSGCCSGFTRASLQRGQNTPRGRAKNLVHLRPLLHSPAVVLLQLRSLCSSKTRGQLVPVSPHVSQLDVKDIFIQHWKLAVGAFTVLKSLAWRMSAVRRWGRGWKCYSLMLGLSFPSKPDPQFPVIQGKLRLWIVRLVIPQTTGVHPNPNSCMRCTEATQQLPGTRSFKERGNISTAASFSLSENDYTPEALTKKQM